MGKIAPLNLYLCLKNVVKLSFRLLAVCLGEPSVAANASTDYVADRSYVYDPTSANYTSPPPGFVVATCNADHEAAFNITIQTITCTEAGWNPTRLLPCQRGEDGCQLRDYRR